MLYKHYILLPLWDSKRWPNFTPHELSCNCCGEYYHDPDSLDKLQYLRNILNQPVILNSAHRCKRHNQRERGSSKSQHLKIAFDISLENQHSRAVLIKALTAGFTAIGIYNNFIHVDNRKVAKEWPIVFWKGKY